MRGHFIKILVFALVAAVPAVAQELTLDECDSEEHRCTWWC